MTRGMATFDFEPYGTVPPANPIFLPVSGYRKEEGTGPHHQIFMDDRGGCASSYRECREMVRRGEAQAGEFRRNGKGGKDSGSTAPTFRFPTKTAKGRGPSRSPGMSPNGPRPARNGSDSTALSLKMGATAEETSAQLTSQAVGMALRTDDAVEELGRSRHDIGTGIRDITNIAGQANLLALSAAIDAALVASMRSGATPKPRPA